MDEFYASSRRQKFLQRFRQTATPGDDQILRDRKHYGYLIIIGSYLLFIFSIYSMVISKFMPYTGNSLMDAIKDDYYYGALIVLLIPVTFFSVYLNWLSLKFFRHN